jgi:hypothetical protein
MIDNSILKSHLSDRLKEIDAYVDNAIQNDYINVLIKKYSSELKYYKYIETVEEFSLLHLKGAMRYINKYDKKLRFGGLLIKIYKKQNNGKWYAIIKKQDKKYYVSFDANYIFYLTSQDDIMRDSLMCFMTEYENGIYETK